MAAGSGLPPFFQRLEIARSVFSWVWKAEPSLFPSIGNFRLIFFRGLDMFRLLSSTLWKM
jgi:hypothetical protein